ncbi:MAG: filamentous hemagglutinin N-terminal domain-containing protein [Leptolyngbya sp. SIO1E4]|nr:filamentous hemagglutinin N-terminal domain-containing protein [Leptolyngbya sp. SIO1E4]
MKLESLTGLAILGGSSVLLLLASTRTLADSITAETGSQTQVVQSGNEFNITGGLTSADGQSLFHSFEAFGLSSAQTATFLSQPEVQAILGRVIGGDVSFIDGLLRVTGSSADLYLVNPAGILIGENAQLDLSGSFAATTASGISFAEGIFNAVGSDDYTQLIGTPTGFVFATDNPGAIVNAANLRVSPGESITLVGGQVISTGTLTAPGGDILIAAVPGENWVRVSYPDMVLSLELETLPESASPTAAFTPLSLPDLLTGGEMETATGLVVGPEGAITLVNRDVEIADIPGAAIATGMLDVSGTVGGDVAVVGDRVGLLGVLVDASGEYGGGTVRVGGDYQGQPTLPGSTLTYVSEDSTLTVNGGSDGNGGRVILWSDGTTVFYGDIEAAGGAVSGDGGFIEVSGQQALVFRGTATAPAPYGQVGTLLLDPTDITIRNGTQDGDDSDGSAFLLTEFNFSAADPIPTILYESELENSPGNIDLAIRASNNITLEDLADNELTFNTDPVTPGSITFEAGGAFMVADTEDAIVAPQRSFTITANTITTGAINTSEPSDRGGDVTLNAIGAINIGDVNTLGDSVGLGSGDVTITGSSIQARRIRAGGGFSNASRVELTATSGDIIVDTITAGGGGLEVNAARRFQARDSFDLFVRITLDSSTDAALIDFLMRGDPQPLIDAGLVDTADQVFITIPTSILVNPDAGGGGIVIRHGGQANTFSDGNITIQGSGANPDIQFVAGPNDDHTIDIDPTVPDAFFTGFTTLFPAGTFSDSASGTTGAILRGAGDATLVTSFQNQPFVPIDGVPVVDPPGTPSSPGGDLPTDSPDSIEVNTTSLEQLSDADPAAETTAEAEATVVNANETSETPCTAEVVNISSETVEILATCEPLDNEQPGTE